MVLGFSNAASPEVPNSNLEPSRDENLKTNKIESIQEDMKEEEAEDEEGLMLYPYERLTTTSTDPVTDIDVAKREVIYLTSSSMSLLISNR